MGVCEKTLRPQVTIIEPTVTLYMALRGSGVRHRTASTVEAPRPQVGVRLWDYWLKWISIVSKIVSAKEFFGILRLPLDFIQNSIRVTRIVCSERIHVFSASLLG